MKIPSVDYKISGAMALCRDKITLPGVRRRAVKSIAYVEAEMVAESLPKVRVEPVELRTGNNADFVGGPKFLYISDPAVISTMRGGVIMAYATEDKLSELGITPYLGFITCKRVESDDAVKDGFWAEVEDNDYVRIPSEDEMPNMDLITVDPLLATGSTDRNNIRTYEGRISRGLPRKLYFTHVVASEIGVRHLVETLRESPLSKIEIEIFVGQIDRGGIDGTGLDYREFVLPGVGDMSNLLCSSDSQHAENQGMSLQDFKQKYPLGVRRELEPTLPFLHYK